MSPDAAKLSKINEAIGKLSLAQADLLTAAPDPAGPGRSIESSRAEIAD